MLARQALYYLSHYTSSFLFLSLFHPLMQSHKKKNLKITIIHWARRLMLVITLLDGDNHGRGWPNKKLGMMVPQSSQLSRKQRQDCGPGLQGTNTF
jgi:hypothetical protein